VRRALLAIAATVIACIPAAAAPTLASDTAPRSRLCADYAAGQLTVEVLGDSIAAGYGVDEPQRWANQLARQLPGPNSAVWQGAVSGSLVGDYRPGGPYYFHVQFTKQVRPSVVLINFRINDQWMSLEHANDGYTPTTFKIRYQALIDEIRTASPTTTIIVAVSPWVLDTRLDAGRWSQWDYINILWELKEANGLRWLDWMRFMPRGNNAAGLMQPDLSHPSAAAQSAIAAHTYEHLAAYCEGVLS